MLLTPTLLGLILAAGPTAPGPHAHGAAAPADTPLELRWRYGLLGWTWQLDLEGAPGQGYLLIPSFEDGPLPLALVDPPNPGLLAVGLDLSNAIRTGFLGADGRAAELYGLPAAPVLVGLDLRAQAVPFPGRAGLLGAPSNAVSTRLTRLGDDVPTQGAPLRPRALHAQPALPDGSVLLVGGRGLPGAPALELERYDPQTQAFEGLGVALDDELRRPEAVVLASGDVLIAGGVRADGAVSGQAWVFRPLTGVLEPVGPLAEGRVFHTLTALPDGGALAIGGTQGYSPNHPLGLPDALTPGKLLASTERFDPTTGQWSPGPPLPAPRAGHATSRVAPGGLFVSGGLAPDQLGVVATGTLWSGDGQGPWANAGSLLQVRAFHAQVETVEGGLLVSGGAQPSGGGLVGVPTSNLFDPQSGLTQLGPVGSGIVIDGREQCLPAPRVPTGPTEFPVSVFGTAPTQPPIVYYLSGGFSQAGANPGQVLGNDDALRSQSALEPWTSMTGGVDVGLGHRVTPVDEGLRLLFVGLQGARLATVE